MLIELGLLLDRQMWEEGGFGPTDVFGVCLPPSPWAMVNEASETCRPNTWRTKGFQCIVNLHKCMHLILS